MDRSYAEPLDLSEMARTANCSRFHFLRAFQAAFGETPGRYLAQRRVERAKDLLRATNLTVTEICFRVGFSSLGCSTPASPNWSASPPSAYRAEVVRRGGPPPIPGCYVLMWSRPQSTASAQSRRSDPR